MNKNEFIGKLQKEKKFFNLIAEEHSWFYKNIFSDYKKFIKTTNHSIHEPIMLTYYSPVENGTDDGFGTYTISALPLNDKGKEELDGVVKELGDKGLLEDIGNLRYESRGQGLWQVDPFDPEDESDGRIRKHSTDNLLVYAFTADSEGEKSGSVKEYDRVIYCLNEEGKRMVFPFRAKKHIPELEI